VSSSVETRGGASVLVSDARVVAEFPGVVLSELLCRQLAFPRVISAVRPIYTAPPVELRRRGDVERSSLPAVRYAERACSTIEKAVKLLQEGMLDEACEEAWRAVLDSVKALSTLLWGIVPTGHRVTRIVVDRVLEHLRSLRKRGILKKDEKIGWIGLMYRIGEELHDYYYEQDRPKRDIEKRIKWVIKHVRRVRRLVYELALSASRPRIALVSYIIEGTIDIVHKIFCKCWKVLERERLGSTHV